MRFFNLQCLG
jgi:hypothetical protein